MALAGILSTQLVNQFFIQDNDFDTSSNNLKKLKVVYDQETVTTNSGT
jgi:hypothetical protein